MRKPPKERSLIPRGSIWREFNDPPGHPGWVIVYGNQWVKYHLLGDKSEIISVKRGNFLELFTRIR